MEFCSFEFQVVAKNEIKLPQYSGSTFRGVFGHALRTTVCITKMLDCENCPLHLQCAYAYVFETVNCRNERIARPFIIEPPLNNKNTYIPGETLNLNLVLIGKALDYFPVIVYAFKEMGRRGIGVNRGKFWLKQVKSKNKILYDFQEQVIRTDFVKQNLFSFKKEHSQNLRIHFITPTAIKVNGKIREDFDFFNLLMAIKRRIKSLYYYHTSNSINLLKINVKDAHSIQIKRKALESFQWKRYSNRQRIKIDFSGFVGTMELEGNLTPFMPLLRMGEVVHVGRGTVYGMGKYMVEKLND